MPTNKSNEPKKKITQKLGTGAKVFHAKFGVGIIDRKLGRKVVRVTFENHGTMNIHSAYLSLT